MASLVHRGPSSITPQQIFHSLHQRFTTAQSPESHIHSNGHRSVVKLTTAVLFGVLIIALFCLGFFTAYLRRCLRNRRNSSSNAAAIAAVTAAAAAIATPPNRRRRGLDSNIIDSFPSIPFSTVQCVKSNKLRYGPECAICLTEFTDEEMMRLIPGCRHVFHAECIDTWLSSHITCPVCRADLSDPVVAAAGESLILDLEERCSDALEIVVEVFHPDLDPDPDPDPDSQLHPTVYPENVRRDLELASPYRRAVSLVSFHGRRSAHLESLIRNESVGRQLQADLSSGLRSGVRILQGTPRHSDPGERPRKLFRHDLHNHEASKYGTGDTSGESGRELGPTCSQIEKGYTHYVSFAGFVINGDVGANDWLPEIIQVSTAMQSTTSN